LTVYQKNKLLRVVSTNIGEKRTVSWRGKQVETGIFKYPVSEGVFLESDDVKKDAVVDRKYHGGIDKACYAYSNDFYEYWQELHPELEWDKGMFGENLTIADLDEKNIFIGDVYSIGEAIVEVSQPREPCFKLNIRFNSSKAVKEFVAFGRSGTYFRVLQDGWVHTGDEFNLIKRVSPQISVYDVFQMTYHDGNHQLREAALNHPALAASSKEAIKRD